MQLWLSGNICRICTSFKIASEKADENYFNKEKIGVGNMKATKNHKMLKGLFLMVVLCALTTISQATLINGQNWADSVTSHTGAIQNYGGTMMDSSTESWVLGQSDADQTNNMHAWDFAEGDLDNVAGWRGGSANQEFVVKFDSALTDITGDDLVIRMYCGKKASASVFVSGDNSSWTSIGSIVGIPLQVPGKPGFLYDAAFDFSGQFSGDVHYVKVHRETVGASSGMFFDSFASVPEPATMFILGLGAVCLRRKKK